MPEQGLGGSSDEQDDASTLVLERRGSWALVAAVLVLVAAGAVLVVTVGSGGDDDSTDTTDAPAISPASDVTALPADGPALIRLPGADTLTEPIWLLAGRSRAENTMLLYRVDGTGEAVVSAPAGQGQVPGEPTRAIRADNAVVWSNGDALFRIDDELSLIPFALDRATAVFPSTDEQVWTVDDENNFVDSPLRQDRQPNVFGELAGELVAPLSSEVFVLRFEGGVGLWIPGFETAYIGLGLLATTPELTVFSERREGVNALVIAQTSPFTVTTTVPLDVEGIPVGEGALSPDRQRIAFHLQRGNRIELAVADVADGTTTSLGIFTDRTAPVWLDDGHLVAVAAPIGERTIVWASSPGTSEPSVPLLELDAGRAWTLAVPTP